MKHLYSAICFLLFIMSGPASAQQDHIISGNIASVPFERFVEQVEKQSPYRFFYDKRSIDTLIVDAAAGQRPLREFLEDILEGTSLHFAIDPAMRVFITSGRPILAEFPPGLFGESASPEKTLDFDFSEYEKKGKGNKDRREQSAHHWKKYGHKGGGYGGRQRERHEHG